MTRISPTATAAVLAATLAGCSGGSGDSAPPAANLAEITTTNATTIASGVITSALDGGDIGALAGLSGTSPVASATPDPLIAKVGSLSAGQAQTMLKQNQIGILQTAFELPIQACAVGGTLAVSGDLANDQSLTPGDTISFTYVDCDDGTIVVDGSMSLTITTFSGDFLAGAFSFGVTVQVTDFTVTEDGVPSSANGTISMTIDATSAPSMSMTITASSLMVGSDSVSNTLSGYTLTQNVDSVTGAYTLNASGSLTSSAFSGQVEFTTTVAIQGSGTGYAFTGEILITGAQGATIRVTVLDATMLRIETDADGDGTVDDVTDTTWDALI